MSLTNLPSNRYKLRFLDAASFELNRKEGSRPSKLWKALCSFCFGRTVELSEIKDHHFRCEDNTILGRTIIQRRIIERTITPIEAAPIPETRYPTTNVPIVRPPIASLPDKNNNDHSTSIPTPVKAPFPETASLLIMNSAQNTHSCEDFARNTSTSLTALSTDITHSTAIKDVGSQLTANSTVGSTAAQFTPVVNQSQQHEEQTAIACTPDITGWEFNHADIDIPESVETFTGECMNASGAIMMSQHFAEKYQDQNNGYSVENPVWEVACNPMDIEVLCELNKDEPMWCLQVLTNRKHWIPVMIKNKKAYIFDSISGAGSELGKREAIYPLKQHGLEIFIADDKRQFDADSCGTDSCTVINKCFQMHEHISDWADKTITDELADRFESAVKSKNTSFIARYKDAIKNDIDITEFNTPPEIQKYMQSIRKVSEYPYKDTAMQPRRKNGQVETMENYVQDRTEINEKNRRIHPTMSKRHKKYKIIASSMLKKRKHHELIKDVLDKTGLAKLIQKYPEHVQKQEQIVELVNQFIADRLKHQVHINDEDSILIPLSLSAVKRELDHIATSL